MSIIRVNDPHKDDERYQVLTLLGRLVDTSAPIKMKQEWLKKLSGYIKGCNLDTEFLDKYGLKGKIYIDEESNLKKIDIVIPEEFVSPAIMENRENQIVTFTVTQKLNI